MTAGWRRVFAVSVLLVVAGCTAPVADDPVSPVASEAPTSTPAATTSDEPPAADQSEGVVVENGSLDVDVNRTFDRVQALVGTEYDGTRVLVRDLTSYKSGDYSGVPFFRVFGIENPALDESQPTGVTTLDATVYVTPAGASPTRIEQVLAHEFVHVAQVRSEMVPWFDGVSLERVTLDEQFARRSLVEGGAVYVTDAYTAEYLPDAQRQSDRIAAAYENGSSGNRVVWSQYHFGAQYVDETVEESGDLASVYEDAPTSTENVLHPGERDELAPLDVDVEDDEYRRVDSRTVQVGELVTRITLRDVTNRSTAVTASSGWGNDRVVVFSTDQTWHVAWVTRWDTEQDADEFAAAAGELGADPDTDSAFRVDRVDDETVVVFAGSEAFVETAEASGNVTVAA